MPYCMWLFLLICHQKSKNWLKRNVCRHFKGEINDPQTLFSENLPFTLSKIISSALEWGKSEGCKCKRHNLAHQKNPAMVPGWLQPLMAMATAAQQLIAKSAMRLQAGGLHPDPAPCHSTKSPGSDAWQGAGGFTDGAEEDVPVHRFLRCSGWPCHDTRAVAFSRWRDHKLWLQPSRKKNAPQVIAQDPNHFWAEIRVLPGLHGYHKDRTADSLSPWCRISVRVPHRHPFSEVLIHPAALEAILVMGVWCAWELALAAQSCGQHWASKDKSLQTNQIAF